MKPPLRPVGDLDLDVRLVRAGQHRRYRIETLGPALWRASIEASDATLSIERVVVSLEQIRGLQRTFRQQIVLDEGRGWTVAAVTAGKAGQSRPSDRRGG